MSENSESKPNLHADRLRKHASDIENWFESSVMTASAQASLRAAADEIERLEAAAVQQAEIARREQGNAIGHLNKIGNLRSEIERLEAANAKLAARQPDLAECLERVREAICCRGPRMAIKIRSGWYDLIEDVRTEFFTAATLAEAAAWLNETPAGDAFPCMNCGEPTTRKLAGDGSNWHVCEACSTDPDRIKKAAGDAGGQLEASGKDLKAEIATLYAERQEIRGLFPESGEDNSLSLLECIRRRLARQSDLAEFLLDTPPASEVQCHT